MSIFELMEERKKIFSNTDNRIYETIRKFPQEYAENRISDLVEQFGFSQAALTRFAKRLGFDGFNVFQYQFRLDYAGVENSHTFQSAAVIYGEYLKRVEEGISEVTMKNLGERIRNSRNVLLAGSNISSLPARYLHMFFNISHQVPSYLCDLDSGLIPTEKQDLFILFSVGSGAGFKAALERWQGKDYAPYRILITLSNRHPLRKYSDEVIVLPGSGFSAHNTNVLPDTLAFLLFCDILARHLNETESE